MSCCHVHLDEENVVRFEDEQNGDRRGAEPPSMLWKSEGGKDSRAKQRIEPTYLHQPTSNEHVSIITASELKKLS